MFRKHYWNPVDAVWYSVLNFVTFLVSTERKCHVCDIIVLKTQSKRISEGCLQEFF